MRDRGSCPLAALNKWNVFFIQAPGDFGQAPLFVCIFAKYALYYENFLFRNGNENDPLRCNASFAPSAKSRLGFPCTSSSILRIP